MERNKNIIFLSKADYNDERVVCVGGGSLNEGVKTASFLRGIGSLLFYDFPH